MFRRRSGGSRASGRHPRGQSLVEVGLILPIFILTLVAVIEFAWYVAVATATTTASREAARYGSAVGDIPASPSPVPQYIDCPGIRNAAREIVEPLVTLPDAAITITYDRVPASGPPTPVGQACVSTSSRPAPSAITQFDRVVVQVQVTYDPITPIMDAFVGNPTITSIDRRSIAKEPSP